MIRFSDVSFSYGPSTVLDKVSFEVKPGEFVFLVGQTGSGKSTILKLIYMDFQPTSGIVMVGKYLSSQIQHRDTPQLRRTLGIIFQDFRLLDDRSIFDNVAFALHVTEVGLSHQRNKMPSELSGGEQQRVVIARALVNHPHFLLADEPTGNLDPTTSREILQLLKDINTRGTAVIMATHNYELVRRVNERILQVREGKIFEVELRTG
jgi:cell division transport system ATP-binding protein